MMHTDDAKALGALPDLSYKDAGFCLDVSRSGTDSASLQQLTDDFAAVHREMQAIEAGAIKNRDECRRVTHFTDRASYPQAPTFTEVEAFFAELRAGAIHGSTGMPIRSIIVNGIGGSALGPQLLQFALCGPNWNVLSSAQRGGGAAVYFVDNTDPAGVMDTLAAVDLAESLVITISKSGSTREPLNNMHAFSAAYAAAGLSFAAHACAVTMADSALDQHAATEGWLRRWPMAESIGGRTSVTAVVGHVPAAAAGIDFRALLDGACAMDEWTRAEALTENPAYVLAAVWYLAGGGRGDRNMVIVPYADRLVLLGRYLQQLVMESLGKERDRDGHTVHQGLTVYGNKGGTDAHAYIQQLNDGRDDFFVTFIEVLEDAALLQVDDDLSMGDYLHNFMQGLSNALAGKGRRVVHLTVEQLDARSLGMLIALYERAVAAYAELININAFHQPGVQAYKLASQALDQLTVQVQQFIAANAGFIGSPEAVLAALNADDSVTVSDVAGILAKLAVNRRTFGGSMISRSWEDKAWRYAVHSTDR
jgi:glucose-6-phosphate isomerase